MPEENKQDTQNSGEQPIITTPTVLKEAIGEAVKEATAGLTGAIEGVAQQVEEIKKSQDAVEAAATTAEATTTQETDAPVVSTANPTPMTEEVKAQATEIASQATEQVIAKATETIEQVASQATEKTEQLAVQAAETVEQAKAAIEEVKAQAAETVEQAKAAIEEVKAQAAETAAQPEPEIKKPEETVPPAKVEVAVVPQENTHTESAAVKHLGRVTQVQAYGSLLMTLVLAAGIVLFAGLYLAERASSEQRASTDAKLIRQLSEDLINIHMYKNENIEKAIQTKMDALRKSGVPDRRAIPMAYIDGEVVKEVTNDLPPSVLSLPFVDELVFNQLKRVSVYADRNLNNRETMP